jgi:hypothetical protein
MLSEIYQGDFRNLANLTLNKVHKVTGDLSFISNGFQSLALPNITDMTGALSITDNQQLFNLSVPTLKHLGGALSLANNTKLTSIQVPKLEQVDGTIDLTGSFEKLDLPGLINVQGGFNAQTSSNSFSCDDVNKLKGGVTKGHEFTCKSNVSNPQSGISGTSTHRNGMDSGSSRVSTDKTMFIIIIPFISFFL